MKKVMLFVSIIIVFAINVYSSSVTLDHTDGTWFDGSDYNIIPGAPVDFYLRLTNDGTEAVTEIFNGFKIESFGAPFTPPTGESVFPEPCCLFDIISNFSNDGFGADTIGFSSTFFTNIPPGYDEVSLIIHTGNFAEGEIMCLDSTFLIPAGDWHWGTASGSFAPDWDGPHCFSVETPCAVPTFRDGYCPDTLIINRCQYSYSYFATQDSISNSLKAYEVIAGPDELIGLHSNTWTYTPQESDWGTTQEIVVKLYNTNCPQYYSLCSTTLIFIDEYVPGDVDYNCNIDIGDLVYMVTYSFLSGPPPTYLDSYDVDGSGEHNIEDIVYLIDFMFGGGPPPVG